jgi:hypothetical protein
MAQAHRRLGGDEKRLWEESVQTLARGVALDGHEPIVIDDLTR